MPYAAVEALKHQYKSGCGTWYGSKWHYVEACIMKAYLESPIAAEAEDNYFFVKAFIDQLIDDHGNMKGVDKTYYSIDQIRMASVLFPLYRREKDHRYKRALDTIFNQLATYPRTQAGSFWHKDNYPHQIWLDGLYMGQPFYVQYIKEFATQKDYSDTLNQFRNVRELMFNEQAQLYYHAYDESREMFWSDRENGRSPHVWARAVGWYVMALVDILELLEDEPVETDELNTLLTESIEGMLRYQHISGMWYQVVEAGGRKGNYLESSGTLMMVYAMLKGVRLGYLPQHYTAYAKAAFDGTLRHYLTAEQGEIRLGGICQSAGLGTHPETGVVRAGDYAYYTGGEPIVVNNGHGVAPLLMAYNEILQSPLIHRP